MEHYPYPYPEPTPLASLSKRLVGQFLDGIVPLLFFVLVIVIATIFRDYGAIFLFIGLAFYLLYVLFADGLGEGQSFGKRIVNTRVVDKETGEPCTYWQSALRNVFYIFGIIDWIFIFGDTRQRLGDKVAGTIVVDA